MTLVFEARRQKEKWRTAYTRTTRGATTIQPWPSRVRVTQFGIESVVLVTPTARITQSGLEFVIQLGTTFTYLPGRKTVRASASGATVSIFGGATLVAGRASAVAKTIPGPNWSVEVFGALALASAIAQPVPNPSFDIRPAARSTKAKVKNPWLSTPFNAQDTFANATVIGATTVPYTVRGNTSGFTTETSEPGGTTSTGWYTFTPTTSGYYEVNLLNSDYNTFLAVYRQGGTGVSGLVLVDSNDNLGGNTASHLYVYLNASTQYWIQIGGASGGAFELDLSYVSATCQPVQVGGTITDNFWVGWSGSSSPSIVGGFGGGGKIGQTRMPANWTALDIALTMDTSNHSYDQWYVGWEVLDSNGVLLGGRGSFFTGPRNGISSWQDKRQLGVGQTVSIHQTYSPSLGGDTSQAYYLALYAFPTAPSQGTLTGSAHALATFTGTCQLPPEINPVRPRAQAYWL